MDAEEARVKNQNEAWKEYKIRCRYFRKVIAGYGIWHHGDCRIFDSDICTCGLLHDLMPLSGPDTLYPKYYKESANQDKKIRTMRDLKQNLKQEKKA